jgi:hypothetical protein
MHPFRVQCETCHARLKVSDAALVGQIHACPKCGGMVLLAAVAGDSSAAVTPPPMEALAVANFEHIEDLGLQQPVAAVVQEVSAKSQAIGRRFTLVTTIGGGVIGIAIGALALWMNQPTAIAPTALAATRERSAAAPIESPSIETPPPAADPPPTKREVEETAPPGSKVEPNPSKEPVRIAVAEPSPIAKPQAAEAPAKIDPLDFDAANLDLVLVKGAGTDPPPIAPTPNAGPAPVTPEENLDERLAMRAGASRAVVRRSETGPLPEVDLTAALATPIAELELPKLPLWRAAEMVGDLSGVAVTVDPAALRMAGLTANHAVPLRGTEVSLAKTLTAVLSPAGLSYAERFGQLTIVRPGAEEPRAVRYEVADLVRETDLDVAEVLRETVLDETDTLEETNATLRITAPLATQYEVLRLLEQWRKSRDLPKRSKYPERFLSAEPSFAGLQSQLADRTTFSFVSPTPLAEVTRYWAKGASVVILVDWQSLAGQEFGPGSQISCSVADKPWSEALTLVLEPLGLTWRAIDAGTIQITTLEADRDRPLVEIYPQPAGVKEIPTPEEGTLFFDARGRMAIFCGPATGHREVWRATQGTER